MSTLLDDLIDSNSHRNTNHGSYGDREFTLPIIYVPEYNIRFWGLERLHPFDVSKWGRVANILLSEWALVGNCLWIAIHLSFANSESDFFSIHSKKRREAIHFIEPNHFITDHELSVVHRWGRIQQWIMIHCLIWHCYQKGVNNVTMACIYIQRWIFAQFEAF